MIAASSSSLVEQDVEGADVVDGLAAEQAVDPAGVVADHAAERAAAVSCRVGSEGELVLFGFVAKGVEDDAGLDAGAARGGVEVENRGHVAGEVDDDSHVAALAGEAGAAATRKNGRAKLAAGGDGGDDVGGVARQDEADWDLAVVRGIGGVKRAGGIVEADLAAHSGFEAGFKFARGGEALVGMPVGLGLTVLKNREG
jgi:hypothetical protein